MIPYLRPDGKSQVTVKYVDGKPEFITALVVSTSTRTSIDIDTLMRPGSHRSRYQAGTA